MSHPRLCVIFTHYPQTLAMVCLTSIGESVETNPGKIYTISIDISVKSVIIPYGWWWWGLGCIFFTLETLQEVFFSVALIETKFKTQNNKIYIKIEPTLQKLVSHPT